MVLLLARCWDYRLKTEDVLELCQGNRRIALCTVVGILEDGETYSTELKQRQRPGQGNCLSVCLITHTSCPTYYNHPTHAVISHTVITSHPITYRPFYNTPFMNTTPHILSTSHPSPLHLLTLLFLHSPPFSLLVHQAKWDNGNMNWFVNVMRNP